MGGNAEAEFLYSEALELRQTASLRPQLAESLNGLGSLKQKQKKYEESESLFTKSLEARRTA